MRILCLDSYGESALDWCLRCQDAGHEVRWSFTETPRNKEIGKGLVQVVRDWREWIRWPDLVFMPDNCKYVRELEAWRKRGTRIVGPNEAGASWELDRGEGMKVLKRAGIDVPPWKQFDSYDAAIAYVKKEGRRLVSKPCGVEGDKSLSYCSHDAADLVYMLQRWKKAGKLKGEFILQEFVEGTEFGVGGWFGPGGWNEGWEENFEHKALMSGEIGPNTGEQGTVMRHVKRSKLARKVLQPLTDQLEEIGYVGCVDVNVIIDGEGTPWPLEFTMRPGWPAFCIDQDLIEGDPAEWLYDLAEGKDAKPFIYDRVAVGAVVTLPDYPHDHKPIDEALDVPIYGLTPSVVERVHPCMVQASEAPHMAGGKVVTAPCWASAGTYVMVVSGTGETVQAARRRCYGAIDRLRMPRSPQWRDDIGLKLKKGLPLLQAHGYAEGLVYA